LRDIADSLDEGDRIDAIIIDFSKDFDLVPYDRLLTKIAASGVNSVVVVCVRDNILRSFAAACGGDWQYTGYIVTTLPSD
jgi:hypothetical protein